MKNVLLTPLFVINVVFLSAQPVVFNNNYGTNSEDVGFSSVVLPDGNYLTLGWTEGTSNGLSDFYLVKNDASGNVLWKKTYGYLNRESGLSITASVTGGYILAGSGRSIGNGLSDCLIYKIDEDGNELWHNTFGFPTDDYLRSLHELPTGELLICGYTEFGNAGKNLLAAKLDAEGDVIWWESIGGSSAEEGWTVTADASGNSYFGGWTQSTSNGNSDFLLVKKSVSGITQFIKTYGGSNVDSGLKLLIDSNRLVFAGSSHSYGSGLSDVLLLNLDLNGNQISQKTFGGPDHDYCRSICKTNDGFALTVKSILIDHLNPILIDHPKLV
ncbi:MAG: hypothetical protein U0V54_07055 [Saprospiraceae bacterium]